MADRSLTYIFAVLAISEIIWLPAEAAAPNEGGQQSLMKIEKCMVRVLKQTRGTKLVAWHKPNASLPEGDSRFLEYTFHGHGILFEVSESEGHFWFVTALPTGLMPPGDSGPHDFDWGTNNLEKRWRAECDASASTITE